MSALKELMGKGIEGAKDDEADGPKPLSVQAGFLKRFFAHGKSGDFNAAAECLNKAIAAGPGDDEEEEGDEGEGPESYKE